MGCDDAKEKETVPEKKEEEKEDIKSNEEEKEKEKEEEESSSGDIDSKLKEYFSAFNDKEISLILKKLESINKKLNFSFLYSKLEVIYDDKSLIKSGKILCSEFIAYYINPEYTGNFGYESQIIGFFPKKVNLIHCYLKDKKMEAKMINTGKIISVLKIEEDDKKNTIKDIAVFEFVYHIKQIKNYGLRVININYNNNLMACSMRIKYDKNKFTIKSNDESAKIKDNEVYIFNKNNIRLTLIDANNSIDLSNKKNKIINLLNNKFEEDEIKEINDALNNMIIKPLETNLIYEKIIHELTNQKDYVKGFLLILHPSFEKEYFNIFQVISNIENETNFKIGELKINDQLIFNLNKIDKYANSDNYYKLSNNSYYYNISTREDFILFEFYLEANSKKAKKDIKYKLDPKSLFNINFNFGTLFKYIIILNGNKVDFGNKNEYKYKETDDKIIFDGKWKMESYDEKKYEKVLPKEISIKIKND